MTHHNASFARATTAIAAILALSSTPLLAQEAPPPEVDTSVETPAPADPLAPEPTAADQAVPPAPQPKVETTKTTTERVTRSASRSPARSTVRRAAMAAPAARAPAPAAAPAPAPLPAEPEPTVAATPAPPPPAAEPAPAPAPAESAMMDLTSEENLPIVGGAALGLLALGGAGIVAMRRKRRREDEEFEARQQALDMIEDEKPALELDRADEVQPGPAFARHPGPIHDPVPADRTPAQVAGKGSWETRPDADFMIRRAGVNAKTPVEHH